MRQAKAASTCAACVQAGAGASATPASQGGDENSPRASPSAPSATTRAESAEAPRRVGPQARSGTACGQHPQALDTRAMASWRWPRSRRRQRVGELGSYRTVRGSTLVSLPVNLRSRRSCPRSASPPSLKGVGTARMGRANRADDLGEAPIAAPPPAATRPSARRACRASPPPPPFRRVYHRLCVQATARRRDCPQCVGRPRTAPRRRDTSAWRIPSRAARRQYVRSHPARARRAAAGVVNERESMPGPRLIRRHAGSSRPSTSCLPLHRSKASADKLTTSSCRLSGHPTRKTIKH